MYTQLGHCFPFPTFNWFSQIPNLRVKIKVDRELFKNRINVQLGNYTNGRIIGNLIEWFKQIIDESDEEYLKQLLQFWTGSPHVSTVNDVFDYVVLVMDLDVSRWPVSHTCIYQLEIPPYQSYAQLKQLLSRSVAEGIGFNLS